MLHVWNGFKLKAFGYIKSLEPKSLIYPTEKKQMCWTDNLFGGNLYSFKCNMCAINCHVDMPHLIFLIGHQLQCC